MALCWPFWMAFIQFSPEWLNVVAPDSELIFPLECRVFWVGIVASNCRWMGSIPKHIRCDCILWLVCNVICGKLFMCVICTRNCHYFFIVFVCAIHQSHANYKVRKASTIQSFVSYFDIRQSTYHIVATKTPTDSIATERREFGGRLSHSSYTRLHRA